MRAILLCILLVSPVLGWFDVPHLLTARIAYDELMEKGHENLIEKAEKFMWAFARYTRLEGDHKFVECATFADVAKLRGWRTTGHWHYMNIPYIRKDYSGATIENTQYGVAWALDEIKTIMYFFGRPRPQANGWVRSEIGSTFQMRFMIHLFGDIHQPMHTTTMYSANYPQGTLGGNFFTLKEHKGIKNIHALWDSVCYTYTDYETLPLAEHRWEWYGEESRRLRDMNPRDTIEELGETDMKQWAQEGHEIAKGFAYENIQEDTIPSDEYITECVKICNKQIVKGGYRLADTLIDIWTGEANDELEAKYLDLETEEEDEYEEEEEDWESL